MNGTVFTLATYAANPGAAYAAIVLGDSAVALGGVYPADRRNVARTWSGIRALRSRSVSPEQRSAP